MKDLYIYNTLTRQKELFRPIKDKNVRFYHCGPTVYWVQHIGNMRGMTMADLIRRTLLYIGYDVTFVRNYTDVGHLTSDADEGEDKMEKGARREGLSPDEIAKKYIKMFEEDIAAINTISPTHKPRATEYINEIIDAVAQLIENGYAYESDYAVYFDVSKAKEYTKLSGQKMENLDAGAGSGSVIDSQKRNPSDFALWVFKAGDHASAIQTWESPFNSKLVEKGRGFPGWHIECSVMSMKLLGKTIDIHMGGVEHIPIHHTNEIAQSEALNGERFVNYWVHNEHLLVNNKKMAKSEGTSYSVKDIVAMGFEPLVLRYLFLNAHYRSKQNFTEESLKSAASALSSMRKYITDWAAKGISDKGPVNAEWKDRFINVIVDDFNIPAGLALTWEMVKSDISADQKLATLLDFDSVLGLKLSDTYVNALKRGSSINREDVEKLVRDRTEAKKTKDYLRADGIRKTLDEMGVKIDDTAAGTVWSMK